MLECIRVAHARIDAGTGLVLDATGAVVPQTRVLATSERRTRLEDLPLQPDTPTEPFDRPLIVASNGGWRNHFHWLIQAVFSAWEWAQSGEDQDALFLTPRLTQRQRESLCMTGLSAALHYESNAKISSPCAIILLSGFSRLVRDPQARMRGFGDFLLAQTSPMEDAPRKIYVSRRDAKKRVLENEAEIEAALADRGFTVVTLTGLPFQDQMRLFHAADVVVGAHGAGLSNVVFCRPGTRVVELRASTYVNDCFEMLSGFCGLRHVTELFPAGSFSHDIRWSADLQRVISSAEGADSGLSTP